MKSKNLKVTLVLTLCFITFLKTNAQVTIGSGEAPARAALLDIKDGKPNDDNVTSTRGGVVLPRVQLNDISTLEPFIGVNDTNEALKKEHVGLTVYNLTNSGDLEEGIMVWDGEKWRRLSDTDTAWLTKGNTGTNPATDFVGTKDSTNLVIRTNDTQRMELSADGAVTINAKSNGDNEVYLKGKLTNNTDAYPLAVDPTTGRVSVIKGEAANSKAINYQKYIITVDADNSGGDWVNSMDTSIPEEDYTVVVVGHSFKTLDEKGEYTTSLMRTNTEVEPGFEKYGTYNASQVYAFATNNTNPQENNYNIKTWKLRADYIGGGTANKKPGQWEIYCLIINNSMVKTLPEIRTLAVGPTGYGHVEKPSGL